MIAPQTIRGSLTKLTQETQQQMVVHEPVILASLSGSAKVVIFSMCFFSIFSLLPLFGLVVCSTFPMQILERKIVILFLKKIIWKEDGSEVSSRFAC
jgi:hypothetical protein